MITLVWEYDRDESMFDGMVFRAYGSTNLRDWVLKAAIEAPQWETNWSVTLPKIYSREFYKVGASNALSTVYTNL